MEINIIQTQFTPTGCILIYQTKKGLREFIYDGDGCASYIRMSAINELKKELSNECR